MAITRTRAGNFLRMLDDRFDLGTLGRREEIVSLEPDAMAAVLAATIVRKLSFANRRIE